MPIVLKSGNLNPLTPSGPVQACNGTALPFLPLDGSTSSVTMELSLYVTLDIDLFSIFFYCVSVEQSVNIVADCHMTSRG